ncbi:hypothetical protein Nocox_23590 [Nonomuraea coxensis DSM 45129]|uniref:Secreted protein n=1 Tax=Nonomuraea coxensis DSM 45129 TaxID=1122611 RepID=A0ABX8U3J6_9ACTN|nr:hypothetical protein [Nonomuraea coxensis]QYC42321.1 hypothetical protein Nocox_23590 [Nonomuraea coxensis DSM 45129]
MRLARLLALAALLALLPVLLPVGASPAAAHNVSARADLRIAQTIAGTELTVVVKGTSRVPGPLRIGITAYQPVTALPVALEVRSAEDGRTVTGQALASADPRYTELRVERTGPHVLTLRAGGESAVVPFRVLVERGSGAELLIYGGFFVAGVLLVGGLLFGALARPGPAMAVAAGAAAGVTVAAMAVVFEPMVPAGPPDGAAPSVTALAGGGRPYVQERVTTEPARPVAGEEFTLRVDLVDGSTGRPVDDLTVHHEALAHLVVTSEDGSYFRHVHPLRTGPGRLEVRLRADRSGRYLAHTELEREDSGGQLLTSAFAVHAPGPQRATGDADDAGDGTGSDANASTGDGTGGTGDGTGGTGDGTGGGVRTGVAGPVLTPVVPVAGRPATIEMDAAGPVRPWLGMAGHLIVRDRDGGFLGHVHEMGSPDSRLRFTFSFPAAGSYLAWVQYALAGRIVTVPFTVEVTAQENAR